jgi:hypothetical protein
MSLPDEEVLDELDDESRLSLYIQGAVAENTSEDDCQMKMVLPQTVTISMDFPQHSPQLLKNLSCLESDSCSPLAPANLDDFHRETMGKMSPSQE